MKDTRRVIKIQLEDYGRLQTIAEKTRRTLAGTIAHLLDTCGYFESRKEKLLAKSK